jgi:hypothetical protein
MKILKFVTLALLGAINAKDHFIVQEPNNNEHKLVQAAGNICELCFFNDANNYQSASTNKFCLTMSGSQRLGFEWKQNTQPYDEENNEGYMELYLDFYSKQSLSLNPVFRLDRLYENDVNINLNEFAIKFTTAFKYNIWQNMLCFDVSTSTDNYIF